MLLGFWVLTIVLACMVISTNPSVLKAAAKPLATYGAVVSANGPVVEAVAKPVSLDGELISAKTPVAEAAVKPVDGIKYSSRVFIPKDHEPTRSPSKNSCTHIPVGNPVNCKPPIRKP